NLLKEIILDLKRRGRVIIFSTHLMDFAEKLCDHIALIDRGKILLNDSLINLKAKYGQRNVSLNFSGDISFLNNNPIVEKIEDFGNTVGIKVKNPNQTQQLLKLLVDNNVQVNKFDANEISLHEIFIHVAGKENENVF
ncbi:MAG: DUF4162 domain-containing protein, partial [Ignavibacteriaceae bacterium]|nr:DUF4162 domain-containing protein [Ignavibacteriaceae bacterium]